MAKNFIENQNAAYAFLGVEPTADDSDKATYNAEQTEQSNQAAEPIEPQNKKTAARKKASDKRTERVSLVLTPGTYKKVKAEAYRKHTTINDYLNELIERNI